MRGKPNPPAPLAPAGHLRPAGEEGTDLTPCPPSPRGKGGRSSPVSAGGRAVLSLRRIRQSVQAIALVLFFYLAVAATFPLVSPLPVDLFFRADPLAGLAASLSARELAPHALWALPVALATILLGRVFCGWLCPLGTTLDVFRFDDRTKRRDYPRLRPTKHLLLLLLVVGALLGVLLLAVLDPITLCMRAVGTAILPSLNLVVTAALLALYQTGLAPDLVLAVDGLLRPAVLPVQQHTYQMSVVLAGLLAGVVALNLLAPRFWCRYLCPLGALLGVLGRATPLQRRVGPECTSCGRCVAQCKMAAIRPKGFRGDAAECVQCFDCVDECPERAIGVRLGWPEPAYSPSRRQFLAAAGLGVAGVAVLRVDASASGLDQHLVRPPGAAPDFLQRCIRCSQCVKVCPTGGLQPAGLQSGWEGLWSPVLVGRLGYCEWSCNACGQVCPTGAIKPLALAQKRKTFIGTAYIDQNRCIPWADQRDCIVCQEMCPLPEKAIVLDPVEVADESGGKRVLKRPRVIREWCIGCAICENRCPVPREAAIRVYSLAGSPRERNLAG